MAQELKRYDRQLRNCRRRLKARVAQAKQRQASKDAAGSPAVVHPSAAATATSDATPSSTTSPQDLGTLLPQERVFTTRMARDIQPEEEEKVKVERQEEFDKLRGFHQSFDYPTRVDIELRVTTIRYQVETLTDPETGKSVRASMDPYGPRGLSLTWRALAALIKMHVGFAIPTNRMALMLGNRRLGSAKICRSLRYAAAKLLHIYLALPGMLSTSSILSGDDTKTRVLDLDEPEDPGAAQSETSAEEDSDSDVDLPLHEEINRELGFQAPRADGMGGKKQLNVSLIMGRTEADPRSTICFFRTHQGSVGNLLSRILEWRSPRLGKVILQGDLSNTNLPEMALRTKVPYEIAGCGAHARRPFWRFRNDDHSLCYFMLSGFLLLSELEKRIDVEGRTYERTLKLRSRYGTMIWQAMKNRCIAACTGVPPTPITVSPDRLIHWPPDSRLYVAAQYVINHFEQLTRYLKDPRLEYTNNARERGLRAEKLMLLNSKFRKTRKGRAVLDILRTFDASCTAAEIELEDYLQYVFTHEEESKANPEQFTPFAVACKLEKLKAEAERRAQAPPPGESQQLQA